MASVKLVFLGTSSGIPTIERNVSCTALCIDKKIWLVDCGDGSQIQLLRKGLAFQRIERIFITHLHGDHFYGLPGLLAMLTMKKINHPVEVIGPKGIKNLLENIFTVTQIYLCYHLEIIELEEGQQPMEWMKQEEKGLWKVEARPLVHRVPCFGFVFKEFLPGGFDSTLAIAKGVPKSQLSKLSSGTDIELPDGSTVNRDQFLKPLIPGRCITILGDTCDSSSIIECGRNSDILVHETTFDSSLHEEAIKSGHSTTHMAALFAAEIQAKKLIITHFSARYEDRNEITVAHLLKETQSLCPQIEVMAARDMMEFDVPRKK